MALRIRRQKSVWLGTKIILIFFIFLLACPLASPETLKLKSGKIVHGKILNRSERSIELDVGLDFPITYYSDEILEITEDKSAVSTAEDTTIPKINPKISQADGLEQKGLSLIENGDMNGGLALIRQAIAVDPQGNRHLNLGGILFGNAVSLFKDDKKDEAMPMFREAEKEIQEAIKLFNPDEETILLSQAYDMLGEMYAKAFDDKAKAREFYKKSLSFYGNPQAEDALKAL